MKPIRFIPSQTNVPFMRVRMFACGLSCILSIASLLFFFMFGLNYGIDFRGGVLLEVQSKAVSANLSEMRRELSQLEIGEIELQKFGAPDEVLIRVELQPGGGDAQQSVLLKVKEALGDTVTYRRMEIVGPKVSGELIKRGIISVVAALFAVLIYIWFRFEWQFAVGIIVATIHDILLMIGVFSLLQIEFGLPIIAAILTIVGYSLNDTVVVFDRVRDNLHRYKKMLLPELLDLSVNRTLSRTMLTSGTTLIALLSLYILGGEVLRGFAYAMIIGVVIGTYSSIFVASPLLLLLDIRREARNES